MWVRFTAVHWHRYNRQLKRRYLPGAEHNLPRSVAEKAVADGHAVKMKKRSRDSEAELMDAQEA
jgi:hypothetical protein